MKKIEIRYQLVYVMEDGAQLFWKVFRTLDEYEDFECGVPLAYKKRLGIRSISYRVLYVDVEG